ncbi:MAG: histidine kinase [Actinomycetia bacterium]|nr:histidine kinase [Actinomycetes bacterium]
MIGVSLTKPSTGRGAALLRRIAAAPGLPLVATALLGTLALLETVLHPGSPAGNLLQALVLALCTTAPLAFARSQPLPAGATITVAVLLTLVIGRQPTVAGLLAQTAVLYLIGLRLSPRAALLFAVPFVAYAVGPAESDTGGKAFGVGLLVAAAGALAAGSARRACTEAADRTAADWAYADTVHAHAARGERARIARELHDIVAHHISTISMQAETARLTTHGLPAEGATRLLAIGETARQALTEMRRLLGVLRDDAGAETTRMPQPGLGQLITLVDEARDTAGLGIWLIVHGQVTPMDPGIELTAYRIVQEALTNARRHAPGAPVDVELRYTDDALHLNVRDSGPGRPDIAAPDGGHGLLGMRERAAMAGGTLRTGHGPAGGFLIEAVLPVPKPAG